MAYGTTPYFNINEVRLYGMPNLVNSSTIVITSYSPISLDGGPENLINNLDMQSHRWDLPPIIDAAETPADFNSCFRVDSSAIVGPYVLGLDHG